MTVTEAQTKFKSLRTQYRQILNYESRKKKSGAARQDLPKWALYDSMEFLRAHETPNE